MQMSRDNQVLVTRSGKWAAVLAFIKMLADYAGDYMSGSKRKRMARLNQEKQNVK